MDRKITMYFGLAFMAAVAAIAVLGLFSFSAMRPAEASFKDTQGNFDRERLAESVVNAPATVPVTQVNVTNNPSRPGAQASYNITFQTPAALVNAADEIIIRFAKEFQAPTSVDRNQVSISADAVTTPPGAGQPGSPNQAVPPLEVSVDFVGTENNEPELRLRVPDMDPGENTGGNNIAANSNVTVVIRQAAGIRNPLEGNAGRSVSVATTQDTTLVSANVLVPWIVELSASDGGRGTQLTVVGRGFRSATTTTFWRDADGDGNRNPGELDLCSATAGMDFVATCTFTVTNPPFAPRFFATGGNCNFGTLTGCNFINAIDGRNNTSSIINQNDVNRQRFDLRGSVIASPNAGNPGDTLVIQLRDFPQEVIPSDPAARTGNQLLRLGGRPVTVASNVTIDANGEATFNARIPDGVAQGVQALEVATDTSTIRRTNITVGGATLIPTPDAVVPNQRMSLIGTGFTSSDVQSTRLINEQDPTLGASGVAGCPQVSRMTIGGAVIPRENINDGATINIDAGGSWSASIDIPINTSTTTEGAKELKVIDCHGREGTSMITFTPRQIAITPPEGRVGTNVTLTGSNFPAQNDDAPGGTPTVSITYDAGVTTATTTATSDASGNWTANLRVPTNASIPSTNTVRTEFRDANNTLVVTTVTHQVPRASISMETTSGPAGTPVTVRAEGFRRFSPVESVRVGNIEVTPAPRPSTDENGNVTIEFAIPGVDTGVQTVEVRVAGTTASLGFIVTSSGAPVGGAANPVMDAVQPLADNLVRVFYFNNDTKAWNFYDPRPEFTEANTLDNVVQGQPYWVRVTENQTVTLNGQSRNLTCVNPGTPQEDCWNLIVW